MSQMSTKNLTLCTIKVTAPAKRGFRQPGHFMHWIFPNKIAWTRPKMAIASSAGPKSTLPERTTSGRHSRGKRSFTPRRTPKTQCRKLLLFTTSKKLLVFEQHFFCKWENSLATSDTFEGVWAAAAAQGDSVLTVAVGGLLDDVGVGGFVYNAHNEVTAQKGRNIPMGKIVGKSWIRSVRTDLQDNFTALAKIARFETTDGVNKLLFTRKFRH